jgi:hypothetical protein
MSKITELIQPKNLEENRPISSNEYSNLAENRIKIPAIATLLQRACSKEKQYLKNLLDFKLNVIVE